ncbi:MAG: hypothetical protein Q7K57_26880 [Burkholderiaceae bacterium]|nr:hypothetical protein [Burkholderiaceae bacterium]
MNPQVLLLRICLADASRETEAALFDALVAWGDAQTLFIGGSHASLVVYAALWPMTAQQRKSLKQLLASRLEVASYRMEVTETPDLLGPGERTACMEAISQAARFLAERVNGCADALTALALSYMQRWPCRLTKDGKWLELKNPTLKLQLAISRLDLGPDQAVEALAGRIVAFSELRSLVPDCTGLRWERVEWGGDHPQSRWSAKAEGRQISLAELPGSRLTHPEVMRRLMACICEG